MDGEREDESSPVQLTVTHTHTHTYIHAHKLVCIHQCRLFLASKALLLCTCYFMSNHREKLGERERVIEMHVPIIHFHFFFVQKLKPQTFLFSHCPKTYRNTHTHTHTSGKYILCVNAAVYNGTFLCISVCVYKCSKYSNVQQCMVVVVIVFEKKNYTNKSVAASTSDQTFLFQSRLYIQVN